MDSRIFALCGVAATLLFFGALVVVAGMTPGYSHTADAVNVLLTGNSDKAVAYSVFGFVLPGLLLVGLGAGLHRWLKANDAATNSALLTMLWGGFLAVAGIVAPDASDTLSPRTIIHSGAMLLSGLFFLTGASLFAGQLWGRTGLKGFVFGTAALCLLFMAVFFAGMGLGTGLAQRLGFAAQFIWALMVATLLWRGSAAIGEVSPPENASD